MNRKSFLVAQAELIAVYWPQFRLRQRRWLCALLPSPGNVLFTLLVVGGLLWATGAGALPFRASALDCPSTTTISYQGRLADSSGEPVTSSGIGMCFRLYNTDTGSSPLWEECHIAVPVEDGLFHVLLGCTNPIPVSLLANNSTLWLGVTVGSDSEMEPREQIASVPYAMIASTVADGAITTMKIADRAVTQAKLSEDVSLEPPDGSITGDKLSDSLFILKSGEVPVSVSGSRPFYNFGATTVHFDEPFPNKTLFVDAHLTVDGTYLGIPIARPWTWNSEGFSINSFFYVDRDVTSASVHYTALGY